MEKLIFQIRSLIRAPSSSPRIASDRDSRSPRIARFIPAEIARGEGANACYVSRIKFELGDSQDKVRGGRGGRRIDGNAP